MHRPPCTPSSTPQTPSHDYSQRADTRTTARLPTPPPTAVNRRVVRIGTPTATTIISSDPPQNLVIPQPQPANRQTWRGREPPVPHDQYITLIYPHLIATGMLDYFRIEDGVSKRGGDRKFGSYVTSLTIH